MTRPAERPTDGRPNVAFSPTAGHVVVVHGRATPLAVDRIGRWVATSPLRRRSSSWRSQDARLYPIVTAEGRAILSGNDRAGCRAVDRAALDGR